MTDTATIKAELAEREARADALPIYEALELHAPQLERKIPHGVLTWEYAKAALLTELRANPKLREANPAKVLGAFAYGLQLGLVPGPLGLVHFLPFGTDVVFLIGYRGYIELGYRSGLVAEISAELVHQGDVFKDVRGDSPKIIHEPAGPPGEREIIAAYAYAKLTTRGKVSKVIYEPDWERARASSQLGKSKRGPWADDFPAMVLKTAYRRLEPKLPKTAAMELAEVWDEQPVEPVEELTA